VYIPKVYDEYTTKHVMTAEWIDGVRMSDRKGLERLVTGTVSGSSFWTKDTFSDNLAGPPAGDSTNAIGHKHLNGRNWDGAGTSPSQSLWRDRNIPIKGGDKAIMQSMIDLFCAQMFVFGFIREQSRNSI
jgi:aarF domain-containing kinase